MNYNETEPSVFSSSDDDNGYEDKQQKLAQIIVNNNIIISRPTEFSHGGSVLGHSVLNRGRENADRNLYNDYFSDNPTYSDVAFRRCYRMGRALFVRILNDVARHDNYFVQRSDACNKLGLSGLQKVTAVFRKLAYNLPADATDEYVKTGESTSIESLKKFCRAIVEVYGEKYLRIPNANDVARLLQIGKHRGFPGILGSLDFMHCKWKNCPTACGGQYAGRSGTPSIILEAVADYDLWIWHAHFGMPGSNNDINVLEASHLFAKLAEGITPPVHYVIQGKECNMGYYLADGIYPKWSTIVQTIPDPRGMKKQLFAAKQEACRTDVE